MIIQATAASTPAQTPVLRQSTPSSEGPETKDPPSIQQQPSEDVLEKQDEVTVAEVQDEPHSHAAAAAEEEEEEDVGVGTLESEVREEENTSEDSQKEPASIQVPDVAPQLGEKVKVEEGFETVSL